MLDFVHLGLFSYSPLDEAPLIEPDRFNDAREFCRCGITNLGAGWGVYWGVIELADACFVKVGRAGATTLLRGGIAGGGPRVTEPCDCIRGGTWGNFWSPVNDDEQDVILGARCKMADVTFEIDCEMELWVVIVCGWIVAMDVAGFCGCTFTTVWVFVCDEVDVFGGGQLTFCRCLGCWAAKWKICHLKLKCNWVLNDLWPTMLGLLLLLFNNFLRIEILFLLMASRHIAEHT